MITVTIADLLNSTETLKKLGQRDFPAKLAWSIAKLLKAAEKEIQDFNETRMNLIQKFGSKDENGELITDENNNCKIESESVEEFNKQLNDLINTSVEISGNKLDIGLFDDLKFTPSEMAVLEPFIDMEE